MSDRLSCEEARALAPELSLGSATGEERARLLHHLASCPDCRRLVSELSAVADELLLLAPAHEPPAGFESRVLARVSERQTRSGRLRRLIGFAAVALLAAGAGGGGVFWAVRSDREIASRYRQVLAVANGEYFSAALLHDVHGAKRGLLVGYQGDTSWLFMTIHGPLDPRTYRAELITREGERVLLHSSLDLSGPRPAWGTALSGDFHGTAGVRILDDEGNRVLEARFPGSNRNDST
jgi:putative zinc finger protein